MPKYTKSDLQQAAMKLIHTGGFRLETISYKEQTTKYTYSFKVKFWRAVQVVEPLGDVQLDGFVEWTYKHTEPEEDVIYAILNMSVNKENIVWEARYDGENWTKWKWLEEQ